MAVMNQIRNAPEFVQRTLTRSVSTRSRAHFGSNLDCVVPERPLDRAT